MNLKRLSSYTDPIALAVGLILFMVVPPFLPAWSLFLLTLAIAKALVVIGIVLLLRGGLVSFGHALFFAVGAYAVGFAMKRMEVREVLVLVPFGSIAGATVASLLGLVAARHRAIFFALLNLAFSMVFYGLLLKFYSVTGGSDGMNIHLPIIAGIKPALEHVRVVSYYVTLACGVVSLYVAHRLFNSPLGYTLRAIRDNEIRVDYMGANARRVIYYSYIFTGGIAGLGGALTALAVGHIAPEFSFWTQSAEFVFVAVLGGTGSVFAPIAGSIIFEFLQNYARNLFPYAWHISMGLALLLIILFLPGGLWSIAERFYPRRNR